MHKWSDCSFPLNIAKVVPSYIGGAGFSSVIGNTPAEINFGSYMQGSLTHVIIRNSMLLSCNLENCELYNCDIRDCSIDMCTLQDCTVQASVTQSAIYFSTVVNSQVNLSSIIESEVYASTIKLSHLSEQGETTISGGGCPLNAPQFDYPVSQGDTLCWYGPAVAEMQLCYHAWFLWLMATVTNHPIADTFFKFFMLFAQAHRVTQEDVDTFCDTAESYDLQDLTDDQFNQGLELTYEGYRRDA